MFRTSDGNERESKRNRSARRQIEKELKAREAEEAAQAAALGYDPRQTRGGFRGGPFRGMPTTGFGGRGGRGPVLGAGGRLGGFGPGPLTMAGPGSEPSEPDEENEVRTPQHPLSLGFLILCESGNLQRCHVCSEGFMRARAVFCGRPTSSMMTSSGS